MNKTSLNGADGSLMTGVMYFLYYISSKQEIDVVFFVGWNVTFCKDVTDICFISQQYTWITGSDEFGCK